MYRALIVAALCLIAVPSLAAEPTAVTEVPSGQFPEAPEPSFPNGPILLTNESKLPLQI